MPYMSEKKRMKGYINSLVEFIEKQSIAVLLLAGVGACACVILYLMAA